MEKIRLALDWTPNVNHIGFLVGKEEGIYEAAGINLEITSPGDDNYALTPAKKVELGQADFALCPMESILSYRTKEQAANLKAVATVYKEDVSAIGVLATETGIYSPKDLDDKMYASYQAKYEDEIVKQMIRNDGGRGEIKLTYPAKLGIWETIVKGEFDATWIFLNWEGIQAEKQNLPLRTFKMKDYGIPYSYSPVIATLENKIAERKEAYTHFISASKQGFLSAANNPEKAAEILRSRAADTDQDIDMLAAIKYSTPYFGLDTNWGFMEPENVQEYLHWIYRNKLENKQLNVTDLITNELIV